MRLYRTLQLNANNRELFKMNVSQSSCLRRYYAIVLTGIWIIVFLSIFIKIKKVQYYEGMFESELQHVEIVKKCYEMKKTDEAVNLLDDIMTSKPKLDKTIFFHDTTCLNGTVTFTSRQACAIESAAKWNPNRDIFVLFNSPVGFPSNKMAMSPILNALASYQNVYYRNVDWYKYAVGTPAEDWAKKDQMLQSEHFLGHLSDFMRLLSLYKFGGIHLDLDFIVTKSFDDLWPSFLTTCSREFAANSVLAFESKYTGHQILEMILRNFTEKYNPSEWGINGQILVTNILRDLCNTKNIADKDQCWGIKIYKPHVFYPIHPSDHCRTNQTLVKRYKRNSREAYAIHFNNQTTYKCKMLESEPKNIYRVTAEENCPKVIDASGDEF